MARRWSASFVFFFEGPLKTEPKNLSYAFDTYLLRHVLKVTTMLGRSIDRRSVLMVPTSSRAKSNNIVAGNKLNSDYFSFYSLA